VTAANRPRPRRKPVPKRLPWWKSKVIMGWLAALLSLIASRSGLVAALAPADQAQLASDLFELIGFLAGGGTAVGARILQKHAPPITRI
jgi:hypothetical protein